MQVTTKYLNDTKVSVAILADRQLLDEVKEEVLKELAKDVSVSGFRAGRAPLSMVEKSVNSSTLQQNFLDKAVNKLYELAATKENLIPTAYPAITITKFVPFSTLEFTAEVSVVGKVTLPNYKDIKMSKNEVIVTPNDVNGVVERLRVREATRKVVNRSAKDGDEIVIDFKGVDSETKQPIPRADGKDYPLILGSDTFIPGFEKHLLGLKTKATKSFDIKFPANYSPTSLQNKLVTFTITVKEVKELLPSILDDKFAAKVGPFKTVDDLKDDIKKQLQVEQSNRSMQDYQNKLVDKIVDESELVIPNELIDQEIDLMEKDERQNLVYQGTTWDEHLKQEGVTHEEHRLRNKDQAKRRVKVGIVLGEIAKQENISISEDEFNVRINLLRQQYQDPIVQKELDKPDSRRQIASRLLTEKTLDKIASYNTN
ncbi:MAG TPA: trigger factor [Candidatus Saccharimonadales bacterium]|nr:trigger factor [Candidatus Saccharimonadales bacterium]